MSSVFFRRHFTTECLTLKRLERYLIYTSEGLLLTITHECVLNKLKAMCLIYYLINCSKLFQCAAMFTKDKCTFLPRLAF